MADFMRAKYCNRVHPVSKAWTSGTSQVCKSLTKARENTEKDILWNIDDGCCSMGPEGGGIPIGDQESHDFFF